MSLSMRIPSKYVTSLFCLLGARVHLVVPDEVAFEGYNRIGLKQFQMILAYKVTVPSIE